MSDKMPSPWSEEFYIGNSTARVKGDEIQHYGVKGMKWNEVKSKINSKVDKYQGKNVEARTADAFAKGSWNNLTSAEKQQAVNQGFTKIVGAFPSTSEVDELGRKYAAQAADLAMKENKPWGQADIDAARGRAEAEVKRNADARKAKDTADMQRKQRDAEAASAKKPSGKTSQVDFQRQQREEEAKRKKVAAAKANAAAKKGGRDRI